ncbi:DoxX-like family protein [Paenibacillus sp. HB172176]|uniref:DoxX-like family protein n=1 Tax=Paenibacillus sp. HB172176 TaxID=2493690 RepID=UPI0014396BAC|nr:DoxX-like family protein [Paenibacillus sp. HB172176]
MKLAIRKAAKPIYVERFIRTDMDTIWKHTQSPELHEQWDLRFTKIDYLPKDGDEGSSHLQHFLYETRIGFGLKIAGTGVSRALSQQDVECSSKVALQSDIPGAVQPHSPQESAISRLESSNRATGLSFQSDQRISLILQGSGYWKYTATDEGVIFKTQYDYQTRFGAMGRWFDRCLFRPLFGYATAWSFDLLRIWLEEGIRPAMIKQRALIHYGCAALLALLWIYQGLVPKLLFPGTGELALMQDSGWLTSWLSGGFENGRQSGEASLFADHAFLLQQVLGFVEIGIGMATIMLHRRTWLYRIQGITLTLLPFLAIWGNPMLLAQPFNPVMLSAAMLGLGLFAGMTTRHLPQASNCFRSNKNEQSYGTAWKGRWNRLWPQFTNKH